MRPFVAEVVTTLPPAEAFAAITDWPAHGRHVPATRVRVLHDAGGVGTTFRARTAVGPVGVDDDMRVTRWEPPGPDGRGLATLLKTGRVVRGTARIEVEPRGTGSLVRWTEGVGIGPRALEPLADLVAVPAGRLLFGRVARQLLRDRERAAGRG